MGYYINQDSKGNQMPIFGKANALLADGGILQDGTQFLPDLICVVDRITHEAAIFCYDQREYDYVTRSNKANDDEVTWITHPLAKELSNYKG